MERTTEAEEGVMARAVLIPIVNYILFRSSSNIEKDISSDG